MEFGCSVTEIYLFIPSIFFYGRDVHGLYLDFDFRDLTFQKNISR
jgi:hypothetical protein